MVLVRIGKTIQLQVYVLGVAQKLNGNGLFGMIVEQPIFPDRTVTAPKDFAWQKKVDDLLVTKVFTTIQGEGPFVGLRCTFVRLSGCNFGGKGVNGAGCSFCDSDFRYDLGIRIPIDDLIQMLKAGPTTRPHQDRKLVVITGGEPMLQSNLIKLIERSPDDIRFQIETNGTFFLKDLPPTSDRLYLVVSPKIPELARRQAKKYPELKPIVLERATCLKFVVSADPESPYHNIPEYVNEFKKPVFVSPMAVYRPDVASPNQSVRSAWDPNDVDQTATAANHAYAAQLVLWHGYRLSIQTHLFANVE
jgi:7-carboxy-7-deazaguanine synthase